MSEDDFDFVFKYTTEQAIEDGVLVHPYPDTWKWLLITKAVEDRCLDACGETRTFHQVLKPLLKDCIMEAKRVFEATPDSDEVEFPVVLEHTAVGTVWVMPNEKGGVTVLLPEDY